MARINDDYLRLRAGYLFPEIGRRVASFARTHPEAKLVRLGIGDVTRPLPPAVIEALHRGVEELASAETFRGYGPEKGYGFLRERIVEHDYRARGIEVSADEVYISDGSKCDSGNMQEIFARDCRVAVADPVYPVYVDTNVMAGRGGDPDAQGRYAGIVYMPCTEENGFLPEPPEEPADLVYLCSPNNPTGVVISRAALAAWVAWARDHEAIILFDAAYEAFIRDPDLPRSIFEVEGAREVAIEFRSFSKTAGFTGLRCAFTVIPHELRGRAADGSRVAVESLWARRHSTKFNGASYPVQVGAAAVYEPEGKRQVAALIDDYMENAQRLREGLSKAGYTVHGGEHAPYLWLRAPAGVSSWELFDRMLERAHVVGTPGSGFGPSGEGYFRLSAFGAREDVDEAIRRIRQKLPL